MKLQLPGQAASLSARAAPGAMGVLTPNGVLGCASNILHVAGREPAVCWICPGKALPLHKEKALAFFFFLSSPGVNCSAGQCGLCAPVPALGDGFSSPPHALLTAELFSIRDAEAVCRIKAFLVHLQTA